MEGASSDREQAVRKGSLIVHGKNGLPNILVWLGLGIAGIVLISRKLKKIVRGDFGAFEEKLQLVPHHPLAGLTFSVSDVFDIEGFVTGFGNLDWARTHEVASRTSSVVSALVNGGATCVGKTVVDDMAYSISGYNKHYGNPTNPVAPSRTTGGSSSGAAVAVAANLVDFSLGIDTDGGVRVPASYCGIIGFRPSYGVVPHDGIVPVSSSFDTVGWFANDPSILRRVGHVILQPPVSNQQNPQNVTIADDCFQLLKIPVDRIAPAVIRSTEKLFGRQVLKHQSLGDYLELNVPSLKAFQGRKANGEAKPCAIRTLSIVMQVLKRHEFRQNHEEWIGSVKPSINPVIAALMQERLEIDIENCHTIRNEMRRAFNSLLKDDGILVIPTVAEPPPKIGGKEMFSEDYTSAFSLLSLASISGCCQVSVPLGLHEKYPVSVSLVARHGGDCFLLDTLQKMYASLQEQADILVKFKLSPKEVSQETLADIAKEKGNQACKEKLWQKAIAFYSEAIKLNGSNAIYYANRAAAYFELDCYNQAAADCTKAINLDEKNIGAYLRRGIARQLTGYIKGAKQDFSHALVLEPTNKWAAESLERLRSLYE